MNSHRDALVEVLQRGVDGRSVVVHAAGEVDALNARRLSAALDDAALRCQDKDIVVDLTGISFTSSAVLIVLVEHHQQSRRNGRGLRIAIGDSAVAHMLRRTGLLQVLDTYHTLSDALGS